MKKITVPALFIFTVLAALITCVQDDADPSDPTMCTTEALFGVNVSVIDGSGTVVPDAAVVLTDGSYIETNMFLFNSYVGATERAGNYQLDIYHTNYLPYQTNFFVDADICHVIPVSFTVTLISNSP